MIKVKSRLLLYFKIFIYLLLYNTGKEIITIDKNSSSINPATVAKLRVIIFH
jgi:hypothetical protein